MVVNCWIWVLGTELRSFSKAASAFNLGAISTALGSSLTALDLTEPKANLQSSSFRSNCKLQNQSRGTRFPYVYGPHWCHMSMGFVLAVVIFI